MRKACYFVLIFCFLACKSSDIPYVTIQGSTMGTTYNIIFEAENPQFLKAGIDSLLISINAAVSTYEPGAIISIFNNSYSEYLSMLDSEYYDHFIDNFDIAAKIYDDSNGAFDPTVMPIVNYWGFGYKGKNRVSQVDSLEVKEIMQHVGFKKLTKKEKTIDKEDLKVELDFSGVAKGYAVDEIGKFLSQRKIQSYYVEIGGELFAEGENAQGNVWRTGISVPKQGASKSDFQKIVEISGRGIATSGNYRNFYEVNGEIFSHTINPSTGYPEKSKLLGATIFAPSCALADGYATACMVLGLEKSIEMINLQKDIDGILIFDNGSEEFQVFDSTKK